MPNQVRSTARSLLLLLASLLPVLTFPAGACAAPAQDPPPEPAAKGEIRRMAITEGRDPQIFRGEPEVPQWVQALAGGG